MGVIENILGKKVGRDKYSKNMPVALAVMRPSSVAPKPGTIQIGKDPTPSGPPVAKPSVNPGKIAAQVITTDPKTGLVYNNAAMTKIVGMANPAAVAAQKAVLPYKITTNSNGSQSGIVMTKSGPMDEWNWYRQYQAQRFPGPRK